jgi:hypothetical protein
VFITPSMHSTETASTEMGMELAWKLATSTEHPWPEIRERVVVVIVPSLNPDGVDHVVHWYREHVGTPFEGASLTRLYQYYTGHDNNRDFFALTQAEARIMTRLLYHEWRPQVLWDVHQYGARARERMFVPPYRDPLNPNIDPGIVAGINLIGTRAMADMTRRELSGIVSGTGYDNWWNGGNRSVPARHNIIGILTEVGSVNIASPVFFKPSDLTNPVGDAEYGPSNQFINPWPGGWWRLRDIIDYELAFAESLLGQLSREPRFWLGNTAEAADRAIAEGKSGGVTGWLIPPPQYDLHAARRLADILLLTGIELHTAPDGLTIDGRDYPPGTIVVRRDQPYGRHAKDLLELKNFPSGSKPYDVSGWALAHLFGLRRVETMSPLPDGLVPVTTADEAVAGFAGDPRAAAPGVLSSLDAATWKRVIMGLAEGQTWRFETNEENAGLVYGPGADVPPNDASQLTIAALPRVGVYSPWSGNMDEGWLRWVLDDAGMPFVTVRNEMLRAGRLADFLDVLILPDLTSRQIEAGRSPGTIDDRYTGGLGPDGEQAVEEFVGGGGRLIACQSSATWVIKQFDLPLTDVISKKGSASFSCPGSVLRTVPREHPLTAGLESSIPMMFAGSRAWSIDKPSKDAEPKAERVDALLQFPARNLLYAGYLEGADVIAEHNAWVHARVGQGDIHLFGFRPHYRGWSQATFPLMFRAILLPAP